MKRIVIALLAIITLTACNKDKTEYDASGVFETTEVIVSARQTGSLIRFDVEEGQTLQAGEVVGCIDTVQLSLKRSQLRTSIGVNDAKHLDAQRQLAALNQQLANLQNEQKRFTAMVNDKSATQKQLDDINYQINVIRQQISAQQEQISSNNAALSAQSKTVVEQIAQIDDCIRQSYITVPITGNVINKYAEASEFAVPGKALFKIADISNMKLRAYVPADLLTKLKIGQKVTVYADQGESERKAYNGTISWISDKAEFTPKTIQTREERSNLVYAVKISVKNDGLIKAGMYGDVKF